MSLTEEAVRAFARLFNGRTDCYGSWTGGCIRQPLTLAMYEKHLTTGPYIGVYPMAHDQCTFGCIDIDFDDLQLCRNLQKVAAVKAIQLHIEKTVKGYHLWCFPSERLLPAKTMRRALMAVCKAVGYDPKEVNPKAEILPKGGVGNYVRLPYPGGYKAAERRFIDAESRCNDLDEMFVWLNKDGRTEVSTLQDVARLWAPPPSANMAFDVDASIEVQAALKKTSGLSYTIWRDGVLDGKDRSTTLAHLAHELVNDGLTPSEVYVVLEDADRRMGGKFTSRHDGGEKELTKLVEMALAVKGEV